MFRTHPWHRMRRGPTTLLPEAERTGESCALRGRVGDRDRAQQAGPAPGQQAQGRARARAAACPPGSSGLAEEPWTRPTPVTTGVTAAEVGADTLNAASWKTTGGWR